MTSASAERTLKVEYNRAVSEREGKLNVRTGKKKQDGSRADVTYSNCSSMCVHVSKRGEREREERRAS